MFGGDSSNPMFPVLLEDNCFQYNGNALPQLQLFGDFPVGCSVDPLNYMRNEQMNAINRGTKRGREMETVSKQQKFHTSLNNNFHQDEVGQSGCIMNPNPVSTGLKLSCEEDEPNSSVSTASEGMPVILSLGDNLKTEIDRQKEELDNYIRVQEGSFMKGVRELKQRQTLSFLSAIEKGVGTKLREKDLELESMNCKNKELVERIKQVTTEAQSWHYRAKYNESVVNVLQNNLKQVLAQGAMQVKEGCGDSEVDDAASYTNANNTHVGLGNGFSANRPMFCRACRRKEVCVLLLPCRHLCLCKECEGLVDVCPVCGVVKNASFQVYMS